MIQFKVDGTVIKTVTPPANGGFYELGAFPSNEVENPWSNGANPRMAPFDENVSIIFFYGECDVVTWTCSTVLNCIKFYFYNYTYYYFLLQFHLILNVAAGGAYFPENATPSRPWGGETVII